MSWYAWAYADLVAPTPRQVVFYAIKPITNARHFENVHQVRKLYMNNTLLKFKIVIDTSVCW